MVSVTFWEFNGFKGVFFVDHLFHSSNLSKLKEHYFLR